MAQLANQAAVMENGSGAEGKHEAHDGVRAEHGPLKAAWEHLKGQLAGLVAALITTLYTVSPAGWPQNSWLISLTSDAYLAHWALATYTGMCKEMRSVATPSVNCKDSA